MREMGSAKAMSRAPATPPMLLATLWVPSATTVPTDSSVQIASVSVQVEVATRAQVTVAAPWGSQDPALALAMATTAETTAVTASQATMGPPATTHALDTMLRQEQHHAAMVSVLMDSLVMALAPASTAGHGTALGVVKPAPRDTTVRHVLCAASTLLPTSLGRAAAEEIAPMVSQAQVHAPVNSAMAERTVSTPVHWLTAAPLSAAGVCAIAQEVASAMSISRTTVLGLARNAFPAAMAPTAQVSVPLASMVPATLVLVAPDHVSAPKAIGAHCATLFVPVGSTLLVATMAPAVKLMVVAPATLMPPAASGQEPFATNAMVLTLAIQLSPTARQPAPKAPTVGSVPAGPSVGTETAPSAIYAFQETLPSATVDLRVKSPMNSAHSRTAQRVSTD